MAALNAARDVALENADANGEAMVPMSVVRDLMRTQTGLVRDQAERREATDRAQRAIVNTKSTAWSAVGASLAWRQRSVEGWVC